jgi:peptide/nickel transport system substrate-binding protein
MSDILQPGRSPQGGDMFEPLSEVPVAPAAQLGRRRFLALGGLAALGLATTTACSAGPQSTNNVGGGSKTDTLTAVVGYGNNQSWDPTQTASAFAMAGINNVYEALVEGDPNTRKPYAALAKALPADTSGTSFQIQLRDGAKWSDGQPVTADDVVFTYARVLDPQANVLIRPMFAQWLDSVTKVDATTVEFKLKYAFAYALERIQIAKILPKHVFDGKWADAQGGKTLGSGPYKISEQAPLDHTTFVKNDLYNGPRPAVYKTMLWKSIVDAAPRVAAISGPHPQAAVADNIPAANTGQLTKDGRTVDFVMGQNNVFLLFNTAHKPFDDKRVRQALHMAIDKDKLVQIALKGAGVGADSYLNPSLPDYQKATPDLAYNPGQSKALLAQAGVTSLSITLSSSNTSLVAGAIDVIKEGWDAIGVNTTLDSQDTKALFSKLDNGTDFQVVASSGNPQQFGVDPDLLERFYFNPDSLFVTKYARWKNNDSAALYTLMDSAAQETDADKRKALQKQVLDAIADAAAFYPVVFTKLGTAWDPSQISGIAAQGYPGINVLQAVAH